ncbi:MAG: response regulator transcription factor [Sporomusaceae bacterium]|nr:response regulator transcription factor [Sporomusaceae bacterium]
MNLLLVEDDENLLEALAHLLREVGYSVDLARNGKIGAEMALIGDYDVMVLDRMLPEMDGLALLKEIRQWGKDMPVLFLTAKDSPQDRVEGLDAGADDYLVKPFFTEELLARLRVLTRRKGKGAVGEVIEVAGLILDPLRNEVRKGDQFFQLTVKEVALLELLMVNYKKVVTRECIIDKIWGYNSEIDVASIDVYIHFLRKKLHLKNIKTIRGVGYCLQEAGDVS